MRYEDRSLSRLIWRRQAMPETCFQSDLSNRLHSNSRNIQLRIAIKVSLGINIKVTLITIIQDRALGC